MKKAYTVHFTIAQPATIAIEVKEGQSILDAFVECTIAERTTKVKHAIENAGFKIINIEKIDL